jgi:glucose/arabinose dehydrogenase
MGSQPTHKEGFLLARTIRSLIGCAVVFGAIVTTASAATTSLPTPAKGAKLQVVATGVTTPTAFAFGDGHVFVSDGTTPPAKGGGVYVLENGTAVPVPGSPLISFGITFHKGTLYVSGATVGATGVVAQLYAWSGRNGTGFTNQTTLYSAPPGILLNGIAFGADGRLYAGVDVGETNDHGPKKGLLYDLLSFNSSGKDMKVFATGMRQPWQLAFPKGSSSPFVTDLGQDKPASVEKTVPDFILRVRSGQNYGFPSCNWIVTSKCTKFATPFKFLAPHTDPGGLGIIGNQLYVSEFGFVHTAAVQSISLKGGALKTLLTGFKGEQFIGLGTNDGWVYVGELGASAGAGRVFRVKP